MRISAFLFTATAALALAACSSETDSAAAGGEIAEAEPLPVIQAPEGQQWSEVITQTEAGGYLMGNPDAPIKLVEFGSLTCGACGNFAAQSFAPLRDNYIASGRVSFELRNFVRDPIDLTMAMLTQCGADASYFPLTEQVFANQAQILQSAQQLNPSIGELPAEQRFIAIAQGLGLDQFFAQRGISQNQSNSCLADPATADSLANQTQAAVDEFRIEGTPTFLINGQMLDFNTWPEIETRIQRMGARDQ
ncbi:MAG: thioredoxin domain-containing protein [Pseudomonadota bacterium]